MALNSSCQFSCFNIPKKFIIPYFKENFCSFAVFSRISSYQVYYLFQFAICSFVLLKSEEIAHFDCNQIAHTTIQICWAICLVFNNIRAVRLFNFKFLFCSTLGDIHSQPVAIWSSSRAKISEINLFKITAGAWLFFSWSPPYHWIIDHSQVITMGRKIGLRTKGNKLTRIHS